MTRLPHALRRAILVVLGALRDVIPHDTKRWLLRQGERILPSNIMRRLRAVNVRVKRMSAARGGSAPGGTSTRSPGSVVSEHLPVRASVLLGFDADVLHRMVRDLRATAVIEGDHSPLVITDSLDFAVLRAQHVAFEYIPSHSAWEAASHPQSWVSFLRRRLDHIADVHEPERITVLTGEVPEGLPESLLRGVLAD